MTSSDERDISLLAHDQYMREVRRLARLSREEEQACIHQVMAGRAERLKPVPDARVLTLATQARDRLVENCQPLVIALARRYVRYARSMELLDLVNEGNLGVLALLEQCDLLAVGAFGKLVSCFVRGRILNALRDRDRVVRVAHWVQEELVGFRRTRAALEQERGREPGYEELAERLGVSLERVCWLVEVERSSQVCSLQAVLEADEREEDERDFVSLFQAAQREQRSYEAALGEEVQQALQTVLTPRQREVLQLRYGLFDGASHSQQQAAQVLGVKDRQTVQYHEYRAKARLREALAPVVAVAQESLAV